MRAYFFKEKITYAADRLRHESLSPVGGGHAVTEFHIVAFVRIAYDRHISDGVSIENHNPVVIKGIFVLRNPEIQNIAGIFHRRMRRPSEIFCDTWVGRPVLIHIRRVV